MAKCFLYDRKEIVTYFGDNPENCGTCKNFLVSEIPWANKCFREKDLLEPEKYVEKSRLLFSQANL